ncbi:hypothetical protein Misp01_56290 [Microtetraspora sp. NBRC 13810]|uniref:hypothetical protein n=1 Tax=Microtetraspora sp. NBRC 13810 TaxID=3030990 RepID=UPI0024A2EF2A|nr:hypothetical protein [Microtetraspora sp. NBRC 13810]GLW10501.1 hypothetical protein Misp01_56290 [Microtetraspora sp. NBRC 13810]
MPHTYSTSWDIEGEWFGALAFSATVFTADAVREANTTISHLRDAGAEPVEIRDGVHAYLAVLGEGGSVPGGEGALTLSWVESPGLAVQLFLSEAFDRRPGVDGRAELIKVAERLRVVD